MRLSVAPAVRLRRASVNGWGRGRTQRSQPVGQTDKEERTEGGKRVEG